MQDSCLQPNVITYSAAISTREMEEQWAEALQLFTDLQDPMPAAVRHHEQHYYQPTVLLSSLARQAGSEQMICSSLPT